MKPQKAAELLSVQDSDISVKILELIKPERASKIFNLMDKEVSARLQKQYLNMAK
jgi:flagellar motility protein MotE (MotC chaperone)